MFGGPAWERITDRRTPGQWYLHIFAKEQPDLNWANREVRDDFLKTLRFWSDRGVDGFRIDVAHALTKDLTEPLPSKLELDRADSGDGFDDGTHPFWDRDEVHEIYAEWREVFNEYNPPRTAVAEAWVHATRRARYASPEGLGQAFNFDLLQADFDAEEFREIITRNLAEAEADRGLVHLGLLQPRRRPARHALRAAQASRAQERAGPGRQGLAARPAAPRTELDVELGVRRARAATLLMLALPGSAYLYQGEELGLQEVAEIPDAERQDPAFFRNKGVEMGRDGCRVPLPWTVEGTSFGFGDGGAHLPQPDWFSKYAVEAQDGTENSTLELYRTALKLRRELQAAEELEWLETGNPDVLHFSRPGGWQSVTNFGDTAVELPAGRCCSAALRWTDGKLPANTTAWLR